MSGLLGKRERNADSDSESHDDDGYSQQGKRPDTTYDLRLGKIGSTSSLKIAKGIMPTPEEIKRIMDTMELQQPFSAYEMDDDSASVSRELIENREAALQIINALRAAFETATDDYNTYVGSMSTGESDSQESLSGFDLGSPPRSPSPPPSPFQTQSQSLSQSSFPPPPPPSRSGSFTSSGSTKSIRAFSNKGLTVGHVVTMLKSTTSAAAATATAEEIAIVRREGSVPDDADVDAALNFVPPDLPDAPLGNDEVTEIVPLPFPVVVNGVSLATRFDLDNQIDDAFNELMDIINRSLGRGVRATWWALLTGLNKLLGLIAQALRSGATFAFYYPKITIILLGFAYIQSPFCAFLIRKTLGFAWWVFTTLGSMTTGGQRIAAGYDKMILFITRAAEIIDWCRETGIVTLVQFNELIANIDQLKAMADALKIDQAELLQILLALSEAFGANAAAGAAAGAAPSFLARILERVGVEVVGNVAVPLVLGRIGAAANQGLLTGGRGKRKNKKKNTRKNKKKKTVNKRRKQQRKSKRR